MVIKFPHDVPLETAHDLSPALAFCRSSGSIVFRSLVVAHADDSDAVDGGVGLSVAAAVQSHPVGLAA